MHPFRRLAPVTLRLFVLGVVSIFTNAATAQSDISFEPYSVFVAQNEAFARCGPSDDYYRTDPLRHGQSLDVYAETDDGWLGIRPPEDSFCWIPADTIEIDVASETGVIVEDRTVAWIGTHLGRARTYRWQVQLAKGEPVTVIGKSEREGPDGPQLWYRIVPPSGEYRWVHREQIVMNSEELVASVRQQPGREEIEVFPAAAAQPQNQVSTSSAASQATPTQQPGSSRPNSPQPNAVASSGQSILSQPTDVWQTNDSRGSVEDSGPPPTVAQAAPGETVTDAMKRGGLLASVEFLGRPRLLEIGGAPSAPSSSETAGDGNWVAGTVRPLAANQSAASLQQVTQPDGSNRFNVNPANSIVTNAGLPNPNLPGTILQASGQLPVAPAMRTRNVVSAERIAQIELETQNADVERLSLILSRLMATQASAPEVEPVARASRTLASTSVDAVVAGRARLLAERSEQYRRVAIRRDGESLIRSTDTPTVHNSQALGSQISSGQASLGGSVGNATGSSPEVETSSMSGYLVQVYSARTNSPPFALTDGTGRTIAYVTPIPGVNLRPHLNSKVSVSGNRGFLTGLNTPHILASRAVRPVE